MQIDLRVPADRKSEMMAMPDTEKWAFIQGNKGKLDTLVRSTELFFKKTTFNTLYV